MNGLSQPHTSEITLQRKNHLFRTAFELSQYFEKLGECFRNSPLVNAIEYLQKIVDLVIPIPYKLNCLCPVHTEMFGHVPALFFLNLCIKTAEEAVNSGINLTTVIVEEIVVNITDYLSTTPLLVQVWCSVNRVSQLNQMER